MIDISQRKRASLERAKKARELQAEKKQKKIVNPKEVERALLEILDGELRSFSMPLELNDLRDDYLRALKYDIYNTAYSLTAMVASVPEAYHEEVLKAAADDLPEKGEVRVVVEDIGVNTPGYISLMSKILEDKLKSYVDEKGKQFPKGSHPDRQMKVVIRKDGTKVVTPRKTHIKDEINNPRAAKAEEAEIELNMLLNKEGISEIISAMLSKDEEARKRIVANFSAEQNTNLANITNLISQAEVPLENIIRESAVDTMRYMSLFRKRITRTNHPTDIHTADSERKYDAFRAILLKDSRIINLLKTGETGVVTKLIDVGVGGDTGDVTDGAIGAIREPLGKYFPDVVKAFSDFAESIKTPQMQSKNSAQEIASNSSSTEKIYDATGILLGHVATMFKAFGLDPNSPQNKALILETTKKIIDAGTWSIDKDSKPTVTPADFIAAMKVAIRDVNLKYVQELSELYHGVQPATPEDGANVEKAKLKIKSLIWKRMDMMEAAYSLGIKKLSPEDAARAYATDMMEYINKRRAANPEAMKLVENVFIDRGFPDTVSDNSIPPRIINGEERDDFTTTAYLDRKQVANVLRDAEEHKIRITRLEARKERLKKVGNGDSALKIETIEREISYSQATYDRKVRAMRDPGNYIDHFQKNNPGYDFDIVDITKPGYEANVGYIDDLTKLSTIPGVVFPPLVDEYGHKTGLSQAEALVIKASNFGNIAASAEYRNSSAVFKLTFEKMNEVLKEKGFYAKLAEEGIVPANGKDFNAREFQDILNCERPYSKTIPDDLRDSDKIDEIVNAMKTTMRGWAVKNYEAANATFDNWLRGNTKSMKEIDFFRAVHTMQELMLCGEHPIFFAQVLIAECDKDRTDIEDVACMLQMFHDPNNGPLVGPMVTPLVEYPNDIRKAAELVYNAFSNPHIAEHHERMNKVIGGRRATKYHEVLERMEQGTDPILQATLKDLITEIRDEDLKERIKRHTITELLTNERLRNEYDVNISMLNSTDLSERDREYEKFLNSVKMYEYISMVAGSDANKSGSAAITTLTEDRGYGDIQARIAVFGAMLTKYMGCGSAIHRNAITDALIRTSQGIEKGALLALHFALEYEATVTPFAAAAAGVDLSTSHYGDREIPKELLALHNLGNRLNLKAAPIEMINERVERSNSIVDSYAKEFYATRDYNRHFFRATPTDLDGLYSYANRPQKRIEDSWEPDAARVRTINHNASVLLSGFGASNLYYHTAEFMGYDTSNDKFDVKQLQKAKERYLSDPWEQNIINRSMWAVVHADPADGWKMAGTGVGLTVPLTRSVDEEGVVRIHFGESGSFTAKEIAEGKIKLGYVYQMLSEEKQDFLSIENLNKITDYAKKCGIKNYTADKHDKLLDAVAKAIERNPKSEDGKFPDEKEFKAAAYKAIEKFLPAPTKDIPNYNPAKDKEYKAEYETIRNVIMNYVMERENILGCLRHAACLDTELMNSRKAINILLADMAGKLPPGKKDAGSNKKTLELIREFSPILADQYERNSEELAKSREGIYQVFAKIAEDKKATPKKPIAPESPDFPLYCKGVVNTEIGKVEVGETPPAALHFPAHMVAFAMDNGKFAERNVFVGKA